MFKTSILCHKTKSFVIRRYYQYLDSSAVKEYKVHNGV